MTTFLQLHEAERYDPQSIDQLFIIHQYTTYCAHIFHTVYLVVARAFTGIRNPSSKHFVYDLNTKTGLPSRRPNQVYNGKHLQILVQEVSNATERTVQQVVQALSVQQVVQASSSVYPRSHWSNFLPFPPFPLLFPPSLMIAHTDRSSLPLFIGCSICSKVSKV